MTDTTDTEIDLSVLAQVTPTERDEKPAYATGGAPSGRAVGDSPPKPRRRLPRARAAAPPEPSSDDGPASREFVRDSPSTIDEMLANYKPGVFVKPITEAYMTAAAIVLPFSEPIGTAIMQNAEPCARAWDNAAKVDKRLRKYLMQAMATGAIVPLLIAHMPIATVVAVVLFPGRKLPGVQLPDQTGETVNPVSNGFRRPR